MDLDEHGVVGEQGVAFRVLQVWLACVGTCKFAQGIWDNILFTWLVMNVEFELLEKLRSLYKSQIESHGRGSECDRQLLKDVNYG